MIELILFPIISVLIYLLGVHDGKYEANKKNENTLSAK